MVIERPFGCFTDDARNGDRIALIAGGVGITPIRALLEEMDGDLTLVYRAGSEAELIFRDELEALAHERNVTPSVSAASASLARAAAPAVILPIITLSASGGGRRGLETVDPSARPGVQRVRVSCRIHADGQGDQRLRGRAGDRRRLTSRIKPSVVTRADDVLAGRVVRHRAASVRADRIVRHELSAGQANEERRVTCPWILVGECVVGPK